MYNTLYLLLETLHIAGMSDKCIYMYSTNKERCVDGDMTKYLILWQSFTQCCKWFVHTGGSGAVVCTRAPKAQRHMEESKLPLGFAGSLMWT